MFFVRGGVEGEGRENQNNRCIFYYTIQTGNYYVYFVTWTDAKDKTILYGNASFIFTFAVK